MQEIKFEFPLEIDWLTWEKFYPNWKPVSINSMYTSSPSWKKITKEARFYKSYLSEVLERTLFYKINSDKIFYTAFFQFNSEQKKDGTLNMNHKFDLDNMLKAFQDSLSWMVFEDDKNVKGFFVIDEYYFDDATRISMNIYDKFENDDFINLSTFCRKKLSNLTLNHKFIKYKFPSKDIQPISVNEMYANPTFKNKKWKKWKRITQKALIYKDELKNQTKLHIWEEETLKKDIFYSINFNIVIPQRKDWEINNTYIKDLDNLLKAFQDSLSGLIFEDDIQVRWILAHINYFTEGETNIELELFEFQNDDKILKEILLEIPNKIK